MKHSPIPEKLWGSKSKKRGDDSAIFTRLPSDLDRLFRAAPTMEDALRAAIVERTNIGLDKPFWTPGVTEKLRAALADAGLED